MNNHTQQGAIARPAEQASAPVGIGLKTADKGRFQTAGRMTSILKWTGRDMVSQRFRLMLYRFLTENVPVVNSCIWTWVRLSASQGSFRIVDTESTREREAGERQLQQLAGRLYADMLGKRFGLSSLLPDLFTGLYRDGFVGGFLTLNGDGTRVDSFVPIDPIHIIQRESGQGDRLILQTGDSEIDLDRPDFYYIPLNSNCADPFGGSILRSVPFVSYIEQQLVDDMRRATHNAGFHRLHVKITPPERMAGEADTAYADRANGYFDDTVDMIRSCEVDDNPVTWDNITIEHVGPSSSRDVTGSWFINHRAMIEDVCAGTNLAPYLLGYSYGSTSSWAAFKFDIVMRQVASVQAEISQLFEWIGNIDLALAGSAARCRFEFDNTFAYQARDKTAIESSRVDNILKLYNAGLVDEKTAREKVRTLL